MAVVKLTERFIESKRVAKRTTFKDTLARGLALRITPNGIKSWNFVYRVPGKNPQTLHFGSYPAQSLVSARTRAYELRAAVEAGRDPVAEMKATKGAVPSETAFTFADMVKLYLPFAKSTKKTWRDDEAKINATLLPKWGARALRSITRSDVHDLLDTLIGNGMKEGVNRYQALISRIFTLAQDRGKVEVHPVARMIKRFAEKPRERDLSDDEIRELWESLDDTAAADVLRLRLLTGQRGEENIDMRQEQVDMVAATWTIPATRAKNGHSHIVPLSPTAKEIIKKRYDSAEQPELFRGIRLQGHELKRLGTIARKRGYQWRDLRRTVACQLGKLGYDDTTIGRTLNHARVSVTAKYYNQHSYTLEKRRALDAWDAKLQRIIGGERNVDSPVLPFAQASA